MDRALLASRLTVLCQSIYPDDVVQRIVPQIINMVDDGASHHDGATVPALSEHSVLLITYGNSVLHDGEQPLATLKRFVERHVPEITHIHILPFFPYSSDDGFSVIDYLMVDPALGDWHDIARLGKDRELMFDFVLNHISRESVWFADYVSNHPPGNQYFIELPPDTDVRQVVRPRSQALLTPIYTRRGVSHVWATFSPDQIDLNYENPDVLLDMIGIFITYLNKGASLTRLDAVAFLWKTLGTRCIHLPQTHAVVKLLRVINDAVRPGSLLITETNVPHEENLSYFGSVIDHPEQPEQKVGDEAHLVYQFALPPLILYTMNRGNADLLTNWAQSLAPPPPGCTFLNFTASHDGIGLRALEGILPEHEISSLIDSMQQFGGYVSMKANADGTDSPYEINISYFDAMMVLQGLPAFYIHSLLGTPNDQRGVEVTGRLRSINRKKWQLSELETELEKPHSAQHLVHHELRRRIQLRQSQPAFSPEAAQKVYDLDSHLFIAQRGSGMDAVCCLFNTSAQDVDLPLVKVMHQTDGQVLDVLTGQQHPLEKSVTLLPYQAMWLRVV